MADKGIEDNALHLTLDFEWLAAVLDRRLKSYVHDRTGSGALTVPPPVLKGPGSEYREFLKAFRFTAAERIVLLLALAPYVAPSFMEEALARAGLDKILPELGGMKGANHQGFIPTGETALFVLAGNDIGKRIKFSGLFSPKHKFYTGNILKLDDVTSYEPETSGVITISKMVLHTLTDDKDYQPKFNTAFPAKPITTDYEYEDLVLAPDTKQQLDEIQTWLEFRKPLMVDLGFEHKINGGFKALFFGPPGTGKSLAAAVIGKGKDKETDLPVYRIDLSMVISKYIGETEKNLSAIFDVATDRDWILFFDEADALFGKRSNIQNANDRFANQEVSYLLMRMEEFSGLAILATNLKSNIDKAFLRRFNSMVHFPAPGKQERLRLWDQSFSDKTKLAKDVSIQVLADNYALTGATIMNVVRYASLMSLKKGDKVITRENILTGIKRELAKEVNAISDTRV